MDRQIIKELSSNVDQLHKLTEDLVQKSKDFPAVNRNARRVLAAVDMLKLNLEDDSI
jgi:hypothetical protein